MGMWRLGKLLAAGAALIATLAPQPFAFADGSGPMDPFPITGAYSAFHRADRDHISIIEIAGDYNKDLSNGVPNVEPRAVIAREFLRTHPDNYDFLVAFSTFEFNTGDATAFHWAVQNKVQGIGIRPFDNSALFGSGGKLLGFIDMAALTRYQLDPLDPELETALSVLAHELLHQWGSFVKFKLPDGSVSDALLGKSAAHWSYLLDSNASVQYGADWRDNGDGTFTAVGIRKFFSPLDLYLMGFYKPQEVPPFFLIENAQIDKTKLPEENVTITGTQRIVTIEDIIAAEGPRVPAAEQAQKEFRIGFILLAGPGQEVTDAQIAALNHVRNAFMTRFAILTGGRAVAQVYPEALPTATTGTPTPVTGGELRTTPASIDEGLAWLRSRQRAEGFWSDKDTTTMRDTTVVAGTLFSLDGSFTGTGAALQWLNQNASTNTDYLARHARLLTELGGDTTPVRAQLAALQNADGGWGIAGGYQSNALDTALALLALAGSGDTAAVDKAAQYLLSKQNADGGWSNAPSSPSRAAVTTTVLQALKTIGRQNPAAAAALAWLRTKQNPDGGFGDSPSTVHDTASALQTFMALEALDQIRPNDAAGYLLSRQTTEGSWDGSVYATATAVAALKRFSFPNWVVTGATASPTNPRDGDRVALTITVRNDANIAAPVGVLRVYDGIPGSGGVPIGPDMAVPPLGPGAGVTFSPFWDTFGKAGAHTLVAVVDPDGTQTEMSESDNRASIAITVQPAPAGVDLTFGPTGIAVTPAQPNRLPTTLGISVSVRNLGLTDAPNVRVRLWAGPAGTGTLVGETTLDVLSRSTVLANFSYVLTRPGSVAFTAQLDPDNAVTEANEANNAAVAEATTAPSVDLVVRPADISVDKNPAFLGDDVIFTIKLRNEGTVDAPSTQVRYLITDGNVTRELRTNSVQLGAGQSTEQTVAWRVDLSGSLTFTAQLDPSGLVPEIDEANNVATFALSAGAVTGPNLVVSFHDFTFDPNPGKEGYPLVLSALVRNTGTVAATDAAIAFYNGDPQAGGTLIGTQVIPSLAAGAGTTVSVTWSAIPDSLDKLLFVVADPSNAIMEFSETDNSAFNVLPVLSLPDLATSTGDIVLTPAFPKTGDNVAINVRVANLGAQSAANVVVRAFDGDPAAGGVQIGSDQTLALVNGFGSGSATFAWTATAASNGRPIFVQIDPANAILERVKANNTARRDVAVQDGNLFVTHKYFSPDGDGVKDTTQLFFRLQAVATVTVEVRNKRDKVVRRFSGPTLTNVTAGDVVWDGLDDLGRVVPDGTYGMRVADNAGALVGEVIVQVDNNRSSLLESLGTKFQSFSNLTCEIRDFSGFELTGDDATAFFFVPFNDSPQTPFPKGIYRMQGDGTEIRPIVPESFFKTTNEIPGPRFPPYDSHVFRMDAADDGSRISFVRVDNWTSKDRYWVVDGDGKNLKRLNPKPEFGWLMTWTSPDGNTAYTTTFDNQTFTTSLVAIPTDGVTPSRTLFTGFIDVFRVRFSPDGKKVAIVTNGGIWLVDTATAAAVEVANAVRFDQMISWAPNSSLFAVTEPETGRIGLYDRGGAPVRIIDGPAFAIPPEADFVDRNLSEVQWSASSAEFAFQATMRAFDRLDERIIASDPGGIYAADIATGKVEKVVAFAAVGGCDSECGCGGCASYHVSTWDGSNWTERGVLHYGLQYREQTLDLSKYLPDAAGEYRVRIRQKGLDAAHVEMVSLLLGQSRMAPVTALHLGTSKDVLAQVRYRDHEVLDLHNAELELRWTDLPAGLQDLRLALVAREEEGLSRRNAQPFSYPSEPEKYYEYRLGGTRPLVLDGNQTAQDGLSEPLFKVMSRPNTGHPSGYVYGYVQSDDQYLYAALDFTVDNTLDGEKDWAALRVKTATGWKDFRVTAADQRYGVAGFVRTGVVHQTHKYYEFKIPLSEVGARAGDVVALGFQAYGTAAEIPVDGEDALRFGGNLLWVPGERSLLYQNFNDFGQRVYAFFLDEGNRQQRVFDEWGNDFSDPQFSPTGRQLLFTSSKQAVDPTSVCYQQGFDDRWSFRSLLNLTADLRAIRSAKAGGIQLRGTAADLNFQSFSLAYTPVATPNDWRPIAPASGQPVVDDLFTTWVPPAPGNYFVRLSVEDLAGNVRSTVKRVTWADTPSITDVYRLPAIISPNGDGVNDNAIIHYRVLEPVHLTFEFFNEAGDRVRAITRDHSVVGVEVDLNWDGRDDNGLPVPDGKYRMTVQNYEFFVTVDSTPPSVFLELREAYQSLPGENGAPSIVNVDPGIRWKIEDANLNTSVLERGRGADPGEWSELNLNTLSGCAIVPPPKPEDPRCTGVPLAQFADHRFRARADDLAGNKTVTQTPLPAEQLIVRAFGNHAPVPCGKPTDPLPICPLPIAYKPLSAVPHVPLASPNGEALPTAIEFNPVRFNLAETLRQPVTQMKVQFRRPSESAWSEATLDALWTTAGFAGAFEQLVPAGGISDHVLRITWNLAGVQAGEEYIVRLHAVDVSGADHYSNSFRFKTEGLVFMGLGEGEAFLNEAGHLLRGDPRKEGENILWGKEFIGEPLETVRLFVRSTDDPRYATARELGVVAYPQSVFIYRTKDLESCKHYFGHLEARTEARADPVTGQPIFRTFRTAEKKISLPCLDLRVKVEPVAAGACDAPSPQQSMVRFAPSSLDGSELKLLTLSRPLPNNGGEDVLFNVNKPQSVSIPRSGEPPYPYEFRMDTSPLPEGPFPLTAKLINVNDQQMSVPVVVIVDRTPPLARMTYPLEGQRVCGVPRPREDGGVDNVLTLEGEISDAAGFHYKMERSTAGTAGPFVEFKDSRVVPGQEERLPDFHLKNVAGPLGELLNMNGEISARLRVFDRGGFERCETRSFYFDGLVEGARARLDRPLFSPNGDGQFDEVTLTYEVDEAAILDIDVHSATLGIDGRFTVAAQGLRRLLNQAQILPGAADLAWDGRDASGGVVADGWYAIVLTFKDACGNLQKITVFVNVDNTPPAVSVAFPRTGDPLPMIVEVQGSVNDPHLLNYAVDFGVGPAPDTWVRLAQKPSNTLGTEVLAPWNTFGLEGAHVIRVVAVDTVGNQSVVQVPINVAARTNLIGYLEAAPDLFSPNGDGKRETGALRFGLEENVVVTLAIQDKTGALRRTLVNGQTMNRGPATVAWDGRDDAGNFLADDTYTASLLVALAGNPLLKQEEKVSVVLDRTAPTIEITRPASGFVPPSGGVIGVIQDAHIGEYTVAITSTPASPVWETLDSGTNNRLNAVLGSLQDRVEGEYALKIDAKDQGEIIAGKVVPFIIDNTPPSARLTAPEKGAVVGLKKSPVNVTGTIEEKYLQVYRLNVGSGTAPASWTELASGTALPPPAVIKAWDVSTLADGTYSLQLYAEDKAGLNGESRVTLTVDNTPPTASITAPAELGYVTKAMDIRGSATDANFAEYKLEVAPGAKGASSRWSEVGAGTQAVDNGVLLAWQALPPDGVHTLRLTVKDKADNEAAGLVQVTVDTKPPAAPANLKGVIENRTAARLTWTANGEPDLTGYAVYRDGVRITPAPLAEPTYLDGGLVEGRYTYTVTAFDQAGWESARSNEAAVVIDVTPPATRLSVPANGATVSGLIDVKGTAHSVDDFKEYRLYAGSSATPTAFQLLRRSPVSVLGETITQWNTVVLAEGAQFTLKLEAEDINGNVGSDSVVVTIDNLPPAAPTGLVATPNGANVQLTWNAVTSADLFGYLVFRNDRLANQQGVLVGSMKPFAVTATNYADPALPDGPYTYYIIAMDAAGNMSAPSATAQVSLDTRAPHATIVQPASGTVFDKPLYILATSPDTDIARVQFQYRAVGAPAWINLGAADTALPYEATLDPVALGLAFGNYQLQAVATDQANRTDPAPTPVTVTYKDVTRPATTLGLSHSVNGGDVTLNWTANTDADLAGYYLDRTNDAGSTVRLTLEPISATTFVDSGLDDGTYRYVVTAVDTSGNLADASAPTAALIHTPALKQPYTPTLDASTSVSGSGRGPATLTGEVAGPSDTIPLAPIAVDALGKFTLANVPLALGGNTITVRLTDSRGNVSKPASVVVVRSTPPSKPTGLTADVNGYDVALAWNANPEADILGYRVFRNGAALLPDMPMTDLIATASSFWFFGPPSDAVDFNAFTWWIPVTSAVQPLAGQWLEVEWPEPRIVTQVAFTWGFEEGRALDFDLQAWTGADWVTVAEVRGNPAVEHTVTLVQPYRTTRLRLLLHKAVQPDDSSQPVFLSEFVVFQRPLVATTAFTDQATDGNHSYAVSAVNIYAFEGPPSDAVGHAVGDVFAPEPVTLTATVAATDVTLSWTASTSSDVTAYTIYRDGLLIATLTSLGSLQYLDAGRPNGTYRYVVKAMDNAHNESAPSNEAIATVAIAPPPAPVNLAVTVVSTGGALDLAWSAGAGAAPAAYRVLRSTTAGGPYQPVGETAATATRDAGLTNGTTYFYVVAALDAFGNASVFSNEASGTPLDQAAPFVNLHYPTRPGRLHTTADAFTTIVGRAEPGAQVTLARNGAIVGQGQASITDEFKSFPLSQADDSSIRLSPDGRRVVYQNFDRELRLVDFTSGTNNVIVNLASFDSAWPSWSADGREVVFVDSHQSFFSFHVRAYRVADNTVRDLTSAERDNAYVAVMAPDGRQLAVIGSHNGEDGLWRVDLVSGDWTLLKADSPWNFNFNSLRWSPDSTRLLYINWASGQSLEVLHVPTGSRQVIDGQTDSFGGPNWSADGDAVVFGSTRDGSPQIWRYQLADASTTRLTQGPDEHFSPAPSPDARSLAYIRYIVADDREVIEIRDLVTGAISHIQPRFQFFNSALVPWGAAGYFGVWMDDDTWRRIAPAGRVEFNGVALAAGDNVFNAAAIDAAGNVSAPSGAIVINRHLGDRPDLTVADADLRILPAAPLLGERARVTLTVRNVGAASSSAATLSLVAVDPSGAGTALLDGQVLNPMPPGGAHTLSADWTAEAFVGDYTLVAIVDPANDIVEASEANNLALRTVPIVTDAGQQLLAATDKPSYTPGETVTGTVTVRNYGDPFTGRLELAIEDRQGFTVQVLPSKPITALGYGQTLSEGASWPTASTFAGAYQLHARLYDRDNRLVAEATAPFDITAASQFSAQVSSDRAVYLANDNARVNGTYTYVDGNAPVSGAQALLRILNGQGTVQAETQMTLGDLLPGANGALTLDWNTGTQPVGQYRATLVVTKDGATLAAAEALFRVEAGNAQLAGSLALSEAAPAPGTPQVVTFTVRNLGNAALTQLPIRVSLLSADAVAPIDTREFAADIAVGGEANGTATFDTAALVLKPYTVVLQAQVPVDGASTWVTLATAGFTIADRAPPAVALRQPSDNGFIRGDGVATVFAQDALSAVQRVEIGVDGAPFVAVPVRNAAENLYGDLLKNLAEGTHTIAARASDIWNNTGATGTVAFIVDNTPPQIVVTGVQDGGGYKADVAAQVSFSDVYLDKTTITLNGLPYVSGTAITIDGDYLLTATASDKAGNRAQRDLRFVLDKTPPQIVVTGVQDGGIYNVNVVPVIQVIDARPTTYSATLNGQPFASGTTVSADGSYEIVVTATDSVGNSATLTLRFVIDKTVPIVTITQPADGATVSTRAVDVRGNTEPLASVFLTVGAFQLNGTADAQGAFGFTQVPLAEGTNRIDAFARDRAGNTGPTASVTVRVATVMLTGELLTNKGVLVWLPGAAAIKDCKPSSYDRHHHGHVSQPTLSDRYAPLAALIEATLTREGADYLIVRNEKDFVTALRSRRPGTVILAELHNGGGDGLDDDHDGDHDDGDDHERCHDDHHDGDNGYRGIDADGDDGGYHRGDEGRLRMSFASALELRATAAAGTGVIWIKTHPDNNEHLHDLFGAKPNGSVPKLTQIVLTNSAASVAGTWNTSGFGLRLKLLDGTRVGELRPGTSPAMVLHQHGDGRTALLAFDPANFSDAQGAIDTLANVIRYAAPPANVSAPGAVAALRWTASGMTPPLTLQLKAHLPEGMSFIVAADGSVTGEREALWDRTTATEQSAFNALVRLPQAKGDYVLTAELYENQAGALNLLAEGAFTVVLADGRDELGVAALDLLVNLKVTKKQQAKLQQAIERVQSAVVRAQQDRTDAAYSIAQLLAAYALLEEIDQVPPAVLVSVGRLLGSYQALWSTLPP